MLSTLSVSTSNENSLSSKKGRITLYEEYRLIEKNDSEINGAWKGIHLLLFFLAFIFGSFCTFCFHVLTYLFEDKCVLFPKLISLKEMKKTGITRNRMLYEFMADLDALPVDFVSTQWSDVSTCYLPMYVPLLSGISGLIWTTMFLMCTTGSRSLTGLQRSWRILPTVFIFSLAMGGLCFYTSCITQAGLNDLCLKLAEITGSGSCTYTINVASLAYERRIRGVYQATRLTIISAWIHTLCWLGSVIATIARIVLVVDFRLVKVRAELQGNIEKMLERHEQLIRTDEFSNKDENNSTQQQLPSVKVHFTNKGFGTEPTKATPPSSFQYVALSPKYVSKTKMDAKPLFVAKEHRFIVRTLHEIVNSIENKKQKSTRTSKSESSLHRLKDVRLPSHTEMKGYVSRIRRRLESTVGIQRSTASTSTDTTIVPEREMQSSLQNQEVQTDETKISLLQATSSKASVRTLKPVDEQDSNLSAASPPTPQKNSEGTIKTFFKSFLVNENEINVEPKKLQDKQKQVTEKDEEASTSKPLQRKNEEEQEKVTAKEKPKKKKEKQD